MTITVMEKVSGPSRFNHTGYYKILYLSFVFKFPVIAQGSNPTM